MAGKQQGIRWDDWIIPAVEAFGKKNDLGDFSKSIKFLVRTALNHYGYFEDDYKPGIKDTWKETEELQKRKIGRRKAAS
jgi:hypothetical protein